MVSDADEALDSVVLLMNTTNFFRFPEADTVRGPNLVLSFVSAGVLLIVFLFLMRMLGQKVSFAI